LNHNEPLQQPGQNATAAPTAAPGRSGPVHLHIDNLSSLGGVFEVTEERIRDALVRHPDLADRLRITVSTDGVGLEAQLNTAEVLFVWDFDRSNLKSRAPKLKWIHVHGAGVSHLAPFDWLPSDVALTNSRGVHGQRAAEYVLMALLMLNNRLPEMVTNQRVAQWQQLFNSEISGKTVLIVGVGSIGGSVAEWAKRLGLRVLGIRRTGKRHRHVDEMHRPDALSDLMPRADFVIVTAPQTAQTRHLIGARELDLMKPSAGLVVYSRAGLVDYEALRAKLARHEISAILDVFDPEPLPSTSPLWQTPNLIITPHCSSDDPDAYTPKTLDLLMRNMRRFIEGKTLLNRVSRRFEY
jgi:glyoxylate/hydroxypyruvate reductase